MDQKNIDLELRGRDHGMSRTKDGPNEKTSKNDTRTSHEGLEEDQTKISGARASAVAFRKFFFDGIDEARTGLARWRSAVGLLEVLF